MAPDASLGAERFQAGGRDSLPPRALLLAGSQDAASASAPGAAGEAGVAERPAHHTRGGFRNPSPVDHGRLDVVVPFLVRRLAGFWRDRPGAPPSVANDGARLVLERGSLTARVVHRRHADWHLAAGPFDVHVIGTKFDLSWDPELEVFRLDLREGAVIIGVHAAGKRLDTARAIFQRTGAMRVLG